jgi:hypothetical protein
MEKNIKPDHLTIELDNKVINFDLVFGYLNRNDEIYNFSESRKETIEGYNVELDLDNINNEFVINLENVLVEIDKFHNITLNLDGVIKKGRAKISRHFCFGGISLDLEVYS